MHVITPCIIAPCTHIALRATAGGVQAVLSGSVPSRVVEPVVATEDAIHRRETCTLGVYTALLRNASSKPRNEHDHG